ncbi:MAG TPA: hypothetical protein VF519_11755 [Mycobacteriales bacterium]|jgi:hypothetical protein
MSGLFRRLLGRDPGDDEPARAQPVRDGGAAQRRARFGELAAELRDAAGRLAAVAEVVAAREEQLRRSVDQYDEIAKQAIANGRTIQAESAIASSDAAAAALDALAPQAAEIGTLRGELERAALETERSQDTSAEALRVAEERARRLTVRAHDLAAPHRPRD